MEIRNFRNHKRVYVQYSPQENVSEAILCLINREYFVISGRDKEIFQDSETRNQKSWEEIKEEMNNKPYLVDEVNSSNTGLTGTVRVFLPRDAEVHEIGLRNGRDDSRIDMVSTIPYLSDNKKIKEIKGDYFVYDYDNQKVVVIQNNPEKSVISVYQVKENRKVVFREHNEEEIKKIGLSFLNPFKEFRKDNFPVEIRGDYFLTNQEEEIKKLLFWKNPLFSPISKQIPEDPKEFGRFYNIYINIINRHDSAILHIRDSKLFVTFINNCCGKFVPTHTKKIYKLDGEDDSICKSDSRTYLDICDIIEKGDTLYYYCQDSVSVINITQTGGLTDVQGFIGCIDKYSFSEWQFSEKNSLKRKLLITKDANVKLCTKGEKCSGSIVETIVKKPDSLLSGIEGKGFYKEAFSNGSFLPSNKKLYLVEDNETENN